jgi:hypothetical protein
LAPARSAPKFGPLGRLACLCATLAGASCGEQEIRAIDALPAAEPSSAAGSSSLAGSTSLAGSAGSDARAGAAGAPDAPVQDRGRVQVRDGNLLSDKGTRLRGVTLGIDDTPPGTHVDVSAVAELSSQTGLNAFHVYLENAAEVAGLRTAEADELVEMTSAAGMYLILGMGGGRAGGTFDLEKVRAFWTVYAPRYAARTHVLYEILNIPDRNCNVAYAPETLAMEREMHDLIREHAPSTHVVLFSFVAHPTGPALEANLSALDGAIDWSNASIGFHTQDCAGQNDLAELLAITRPRGIAAFASEMLFYTSFESTNQLEAEQVGWFSFEWLVRTRDLNAFREAHTTAGGTWCPDFGTWPEDAETCRAP